MHHIGIEWNMLFAFQRPLSKCNVIFKLYYVALKKCVNVLGCIFRGYFAIFQLLSALERLKK